MAEKAKEEINSFKEKVKREAEELVLKKFPQKILDLDILSNLEKFSPNSAPKKFEINIPIPELKSGAKMTDPNGTKSEAKAERESHLVADTDDELIICKPFLFPNGEIECHNLLAEMVDLLKPRLLELTEDILLLKLAVSLMVPKIEDGNNFGVEIQQETIEALSGVENEVLKHFDQFETYFEDRGDSIVKVAKFPHNQDYRIAVEERDQKFHLMLCLTLTDIRNHYVSLHDLVTKNLQKIKEPRSQLNKEFLY